MFIQPKHGASHLEDSIVKIQNIYELTEGLTETIDYLVGI